MKCKIRITKEIAGLYPQYTPKFGKIYDAEYIEPTCSNKKVPPICVIDIAGKRIIIRQDEFEIVRLLNSDDGMAASKKEERHEQTYQGTCPFCNRKHEQRLWLNIICPCGSKYYFTKKIWYNRMTGERKDDGQA